MVFIQSIQENQEINRWIVLKYPNLKHFVAAEMRQSGYTINRAIDQLPNGLAVMITAQGGHFELRFY